MVECKCGCCAERPHVAKFPFAVSERKTFSLMATYLCFSSLSLSFLFFSLVLLSSPPDDYIFCLPHAVMHVYEHNDGSLTH